MAIITIRNLDEETKRRLRIQAAENDRSMEEEARIILKEATRTGSSLQGFAEDSAAVETSWVDHIVGRFQALGGVELELPPRPSSREIPDFSGPEYGE